jgi:uncharacterized membrane protein
VKDCKCFSKKKKCLQVSWCNALYTFSLDFVCSSNLVSHFEGGTDNGSVQEQVVKENI